MPQIPLKLVISGRKGADRLRCLNRRKEHLLQQRVSIERPGGNWDAAEAKALEWIIKSILAYEDLLVDAYGEDIDRIKALVKEKWEYL